MFTLKPYEYSNQEIKLFTELGWSALLKEASITPLTLYRLAIEKAFLKDLQGPAIEALRNGGNLLYPQDITKKVMRMTEEFNTAIAF